MTFDDLSQDLSADEKKNLLGKIQASLNLSAKDTDNIVGRTEGAEELKHRLTKDLERMGFFDRLFVRLEAFFRARTETEVLIDRKLAVAKATLREKCPDMVRYSSHEWTPELAKVLYDLYAEAVTLKPVFDHLFQQKLTLEAGLLRILAEEYPVAARDLEDLFPDQDIAEAFRDDPRRNALMGRLDSRLKTYLDEVPTEVFDKVRDRLRPLYYLRPVVAYPWTQLFDLFGHNPDKVEVSKYPHFSPAVWVNTGPLLERLYYGVHVGTKLESEAVNLGLLFEGVADKLSDDKRPWSSEAIHRQVVQLIRQLHAVAARLPWKEVLQWSLQDPFYTVRFVLPQYSVEEFYESTLTMEFHEALDQRLPEIRQRLLFDERAALFKNGLFEPLDFYVPGVGASLGIPKLNGFQYPETLAVLWAFLNHHFAKKIAPFYQSVIRMVAPAGKGILQGLTNAVEDLAGLRTRIQQFDRSLHPDTEGGKNFAKLKAEAGAKVPAVKPFLQMIHEKDDEALDLIERGTQALAGLEGQLGGLKERNIPALKTVLRLPYLLDGQQETVENALDRLVVVVQKMAFILRETRHLET